MQENRNSKTFQINVSAPTNAGAHTRLAGSLETDTSVELSRVASRPRRETVGPGRRAVWEANLLRSSRTTDKALSFRLRDQLIPCNFGRIILI